LTTLFDSFYGEAGDHPARRAGAPAGTLYAGELGIPRATFHLWYDRLLSGGVDALEDRRPRPKRVWNRIPEEVRERIIELALDRPELSPRELAVTFIGAESYFVSEASVFHLPATWTKRPQCFFRSK
jgi:hypothetical protein